MYRNWGEWFKAALIRAIKTFAQTAAASITVGAAVEEVDWLRVLSVSGVAFVLSMLTSLAGLPEAPDVYHMGMEDNQPPDDNVIE